MIATKSRTGNAPAEEPVIKANAKPEVAVHDFLNSRLVDQKRNLVREDLAEQMKCANQLDPLLVSAKAAQSKYFGKYVGSVFKLKASCEEWKIIAAIWAKLPEADFLRCGSEV